MLFMLLFAIVFFGYLSVGLGFLPFALGFFLSLFLIQCGATLDMWLLSEGYCFS